MIPSKSTQASMESGHTITAGEEPSCANIAHVTVDKTMFVPMHAYSTSVWT